MRKKKKPQLTIWCNKSKPEPLDLMDLAELAGYEIQVTKNLELQEEMLAPNLSFIVALDNTLEGSKMYELLLSVKQTPVTLVHPTAYISPKAFIGDGCFIGANSVIETGCIVGHCSVIKPNTVLLPNVYLGDYSYVDPGVSIGERTQLGKSCYIGANCSISSSLTMGCDIIIEPGLVVEQDVPSGSIVQKDPSKISTLC